MQTYNYFVDFAFFLCVNATYEKYKNYKFGMDSILKNGGQKILSLFFCAFDWPKFAHGA